MVNNFGLIVGVVRCYLVLVAATVIALVVLGTVAPEQAGSQAWGHAVVVAVFAVVLPLRVRSARGGDAGAIRAVGIIAGALFLVNVVEALIPGFVPEWMRVEMLVTAAMMVLVVGAVVRERR